MISRRTFGIVLLVVGIILLVFGMNATHSITENTVEGVTGKYTSGTMFYLIGGIVLIIIGGVMALRRKLSK